MKTSIRKKVIDPFMLLRYLVVHALVNRYDIIAIVHDYMSGIKAKDIASKHSISISTVYYYLEPVKEYIDYLSYYKRDVEALKSLLNNIKVDPIVDGNFCRLCNKHIFNPVDHIVEVHYDLVDTIVDRIYYTWLRMLK